MKTFSTTSATNNTLAQAPTQRYDSHRLFRWCFALLILITPVILPAQIPVEAFFGNRQFQHEFFFFKDMDSQQRVNLFSMARFSADYDTEVFNTSLMSSQITYNLNSNWGISGGAVVANNSFSPIVAISYSYFNDAQDLFVNIFPTAIIKDKPEYELFGLAMYRPQITEDISLFTQLLFGTTMNNTLQEHVFSYQQLRIGIGVRDWFQVGIGIDQNQFGEKFDYENNIGLFIRKEF
jgi:hypothetical protein